MDISPRHTWPEPLFVPNTRGSYVTELAVAEQAAAFAVHLSLLRQEPKGLRRAVTSHL